MLHPSYTDLMKVVNQDVARRGIKGCKQPVFHCYGNVQKSETVD